MLALRNLIYYWRGNLAVLLGVAVGSAVMTGALFVGDSLRGSLQTQADRQSNGVKASWTGERLLDERLAAKLGDDIVPALILRGTMTLDKADSGAARTTVIGLDAAGLKAFGLPAMEEWSSDTGQAILSKRLAEKLNARAGERLKLSVQQLSTVPRTSLLGRRGLDDLTTSITFKLSKILDDEPAGDFSLIPSPEAPLNLFVPLPFLQDRLGKAHRVNAMFAFGGTATVLNEKMAATLEPGDWGLKVHVPPARKTYVSVESDQLLVSPQVVEAAEKTAKELNLRSERTTVYLANWIAANEENRIPYSVVAAVNASASAPLGPFLPQGLRELKDDEIVLTDWPDSLLKDVTVGSPITLTYFQPDIEAGAVETSKTFRLAGRIPLDGVAHDPDLTPPFPGITDKLTIGDWNPPFPFDNKRIKPGDANERYWEKHKTTPKAYISRAAGEKIFASRFGVVTSIRIAPGVGETPEHTAKRVSEALRKNVDAPSLGIRFEDTRERLAKASVGGTDFGGLFLGFSCFLILAALVLIGLLVRLSVERRAKDIGSLLAIGFTPRQVRRSLLFEGLLVSLIGTAFGIGFALIYSRGLIRMLTDLWPDASVKAILQPHASPLSATIGAAATLVLVMIAIAIALRGLVKLPIPTLLRGRTEIVEIATATQRRRTIGLILTIVAVLSGIAAIFAGTSQTNPDFQAMAFFSGGGLLFTAGVLLVRRWLKSDHASLNANSSLRSVAARNASRFAGRSTLTVLLIGAATFLLVSVESFRRRPDAGFNAKNGGSGGFNLLASADVPILQPFNREPGRGDFLELYSKELQNRDNEPTADHKRHALVALAKIKLLIALRRRSGDDASCLNLYQAGKPRMLGVPQAMIERGGFKFSASEAKTPEEKANPWLLLAPREDGAIPVIGEQNSVMWMLKKAVGDEIELPNENGNKKRFRIVATLQDSVFQGELLLSHTAFGQLYPHDEGYAEFLIETDSAGEREVSMVLETGLRSHGLIVTRSQERVASYQAVIGTYLTTFQLLGGLGLLLGVLGLAAVVLRGVWERLGEFALLKAVGYSTAQIRFLVLAENLLLLVLGLVLGIITAAISVAPHVALGGQWPWEGVTILIAAVLVTGTVVIWLATAFSLRVPILNALRSE